LAAGRWEDAKSITLEHAPADAHDEIHLFFSSTAERLASENQRNKVAPAGEGARP